MKFSIIIPTLNEEKFLPVVLESICAQNFSVDYEIIVADAHSKDNTREIANQYNAKVVNGGMPGAGRNAGAKIARGEFLLFIDADVVLPADFLKNAYAEMQERFLDLATCEVIPLSDLDIDKFLHQITNVYIRMSQYSNPHAPGFCILCSRRLFERIGGFDETLTMAEDHEFVKRASRFRPLRVLDTTRIQVSVRRLEKEGRFALVQKYIQVELYRMFRGEPRTKIVSYEFGKFDTADDKRRTNLRIALNKQLIRLNENLIAFSRKHGSLDDHTASYQKRLNQFRTRFENIKMRLDKLLGNG